MQQRTRMRNSCSKSFFQFAADITSLDSNKIFLRAYDKTPSCNPRRWPTTKSAGWPRPELLSQVLRAPKMLEQPLRESKHHSNTRLPREQRKSKTKNETTLTPRVRKHFIFSTSVEQSKISAYSPALYSRIPRNGTNIDHRIISVTRRQVHRSHATEPYLTKCSQRTRSLLLKGKKNATRAFLLRYRMQVDAVNSEVCSRKEAIRRRG